MDDWRGARVRARPLGCKHRGADARNSGTPSCGVGTRRISAPVFGGSTGAIASDPLAARFGLGLIGVLALSLPMWGAYQPGSMPVLRMIGAASGAVRYFSNARAASDGPAALCTAAENTVTSWMSGGSGPR